MCARRRRPPEAGVTAEAALTIMLSSERLSSDGRAASMPCATSTGVIAHPLVSLNKLRNFKDIGGRAVLGLVMRE